MSETRRAVMVLSVAAITCLVTHFLCLLIPGDIATTARDMALGAAVVTTGSSWIIQWMHRRDREEPVP